MYELGGPGPVSKDRQLDLDIKQHFINIRDVICDTRSRNLTDILDIF